jgi:hypothetical protein
MREALSIDTETRDIIARRGIANVRENYTKDLMGERTMTVYQEILSDQFGHGG